MKFVPLYFFIALFLGFCLIYTLKNYHRVVVKEKMCSGKKCLI